MKDEMIEKKYEEMGMQCMWLRLRGRSCTG